MIRHVIPLVLLLLTGCATQNLRLARDLRSEDKDTRFRASWDLLSMGDAGIPILADALHDRDPDVQQLASIALSQHGEASLPHFADALRDPATRTVVGSALVVMHQDGKLRKEAIFAELDRVVADDSGTRGIALEIRQWIEKHLREAGKPDANKALESDQ